MSARAPDEPLLQRWRDLALAALGAEREEIDALNVYPVPDGDTGTNLFLTIEAARRELGHRRRRARPADLRLAWRSSPEVRCSGPAGNSGVIVARSLRRLCERLAAAGPERSAALLADTLTLAAEAGVRGGRPAGGGHDADVARAVADAAAGGAASCPGRQPLGHHRAAAEAAREALDGHLSSWPVLEEAGVVDAGGRGLCVLLDAAVSRHRTGRRSRPHGSATSDRRCRDRAPGGPVRRRAWLRGHVSPRRGGHPDPRAAPALAGLGDSLVVVGGDGLWNVHVHVDDVGAAIEAGVVAGRPHRIRVTHFAEPRQPRASGAGSRPGPRGVVAVAAGPGLASLFARRVPIVVERRRAPAGRRRDPRGDPRAGQRLRSSCCPTTPRARGRRGGGPDGARGRASGPR